MSVRLDTARLLLREPEDGDLASLLRFYRVNDARLARWEPDRVDDAAFHLRWVRWRRAESETGHGRSFLGFDRTHPEALVAILNLYDIVAGSTHSAMLGYSVDGAYEGQGYAREAVGAVIAYAFGSLQLHRLRASYDPANDRSGGLLRRLGFTVEGYARDALFLRGTWRDQVLTSLVNPDWHSPAQPPA